MWRGGTCSAGTVYGSRITLQIGITVIVLTLLFEYVLRIMAGCFGGAVDELFMRITE
jgi:ABC-type dipeptide/oligopeptide/nickel transport system permease subunit